MRDDRSVMQLPAVRRYLVSGGLSITGISLMLAVLFKQAFDLTGDPLTIGIIGLLQFVPAVALVLASGYLADRFDRRRLTALMVLGRVACALAYAAYSQGIDDSVPGTAVWPLYLITLVFGTVDAIAIPARRAIVPLLAEPSLLPKVVAANATTFVIATIVGPVAAGYLYSTGPSLAYVVVAALFAASVPPLLGIRYATEPERLTDRPTLAQAVEGLRFVRRSPIVRGAISLDMFAVLFGGAVALIPVIAEERLGVGDVAYGWLRAAPGIGAGLTGLVLARWPVTRRVGSTLLGVVGLFGAFHVVLGLTTSYPVAFVALIAAAGADMVSMTIRSTLIPLATPSSQLGRVTAVESVFIGASNELGAFESGVAARVLGVPWAVAGGGLATLAIAGGFAAFVPALRNIDTYDEVTPDQTVDPPRP